MKTFALPLTTSVILCLVNHYLPELLARLDKVLGRRHGKRKVQRRRRG